MSSFTMLSHTLDITNGLPTECINGFISRKLNGHGVLWDGGLTAGIPAKEFSWYNNNGDYRYKKEMLSTGLWTIGRKGTCKTIQAPDWWIKGLPQGIPLRGEIWYNDRKEVSAVSRTFNKTDFRWKLVTFQVYDYKPYCLWPDDLLTVSPKSKGLQKEYELCFKNIPLGDRYSSVIDKINYNGIVGRVNQSIIADKDYFNNCYTNMKELGWEGLMVCNPYAHYELVRSKNSLKIKPLIDDEVTIIGYEKGNNRHSGKLGSLLVKKTWSSKVVGYPGGKKSFIAKTVTFNVGGGFSDFQREWEYVKRNFPVGKEIVITFNELSRNGVPPSASIKGDI